MLFGNLIITFGEAGVDLKYYSKNKKTPQETHSEIYKKRPICIFLILKIKKIQKQFMAD